jgi:hypothetical protein
MYKGWIAANVVECGRLRALGIEVGPYNDVMERFEDCTADDKAMIALNPHWGEFYWSMPMTEESKSQTTSVVRVSKTGSRFIVTRMPNATVAIHILKVENGVWVTATELYMTINGLETLHDAISEFLAQRSK